MEPLADAGGFCFQALSSGQSGPKRGEIRKGGTLYRVLPFRVSPQDKRETSRYVILYEESCFIDRISLTFHTIV